MQIQQLNDIVCSGANMWTFSVDLEKKIAYPSERLQTKLSIPAEISNFPEGFLDLNLIVPEYNNFFCDSFKSLGPNNPSSTFDAKAIFEDGSIHWIRFVVQLLWDSNGYTTTAAVSGQLIDTQKVLEARLSLQQKGRHENPGKILGYNVYNLSQNKIEEKTLNIPEHGDLAENTSFEEHMKRVSKRIVDVDKREMFLQHHNFEYLKQQFTSGKVQLDLEFRLNLNNGKTIWARNSNYMLLEPTSQEIFCFEYLYDINDQHVMDDMLDAAINFSYERFASISLKEDQCTTKYKKSEKENETLLVESFNKVMAGYCEKNVWKDDKKMYLSKMSAKNVCKEFKDKDFFEFTHRTLEDDGIHYKLNRFILYNRNQMLALTTRIDITKTVTEEEEKQVKLKNALIAAEQATKAKTDFLARMSHDMRTPMNAIIGLSALTLDEADNPAVVQENMTKLRSSSDFLLGLVNDILDLAKIEDGSVELKKEPYLYSEFMLNIHTMFKPMCDAKGVNFILNAPEKNPKIVVDKLRFNQVFFNIFSNAVKFTPPGGTVEYKIDNLVTKDNLLFVDFIIKDTGIGMSAEYQKHLFEPFAQENTSISSELQGTGLGLSISKQLVDLMGGRLSIQSQKNKGTTVTISLSFEYIEEDSNDKVEQKVQTTIDYSNLSNKSVLIVEDHPVNLLIAKKLLEKKNIIVTTAENGLLGLEKFKSSDVNSFDAILMDVRMPIMTGWEATEEIRKLNRPDANTIPIIATTANAYTQDVEKSLACGMNAHIAKPIKPELLYQTLANFF